MTPYFDQGGIVVYHGDSFELLPELEAESIDACVTDPPYGIGFMGREWDTFKPGSHRESKRPAWNGGAKQNPNLKGRARSPAMSPSQIEYDRSLTGQHGFQTWCERWAIEVLRVLKPGGYLLACGAPRSGHRLASGIEDAGFEIRDSIAWISGQGFPKSRNLGDGRGTALKPGYEPVIVARKPFSGSVAANVAQYGTGGLNIDGCRIEIADGDGWDVPSPDMSRIIPARSGAANNTPTTGRHSTMRHTSDHGRWPANVVLDVDSAAELDQQVGELVSGGNPAHRLPHKSGAIGVRGGFTGQKGPIGHRALDHGGPSRFFYVAKPSRAERDLGCESLSLRTPGACADRKEGSAGLNNPRAGAGRSGGGRNFHPTVKPLALMRWLVRLVTPPGGVVLDPFLGSSTTGMACALEQLRFIGIEREADYLPIAERRIRAVLEQPSLFTEASA